MLNQITNQDCLTYMARIATESVDCCITDCPYKIIAGGIRPSHSAGIDYSKTDPKGVLNRGKKCSSELLLNGNTENQILNLNCLEYMAGIANESVDCCITDCPYKITVRSDQGEYLKDPPGGCLSNSSENVRNGGMFAHNDIEFKDWLPELYRILKQGTHTYIMINARNLKNLQVEAEKAGFIFQNLLVWHKGNATPNKYYMQSAEFILMLRKGKAKNINNMGSKTVLSVPNFIGKTSKKLHPTQKPISLLEILLLNSTNLNEIVIDPFCGSGSLALTCQKHNRNFLCCDIDPEYTDMANNNLKLGWEQCQKNWGEVTNPTFNLFHLL